MPWPSSATLRATQRAGRATRRAARAEAARQAETETAAAAEPRSNGATSRGPGRLPPAEERADGRGGSGAAQRRSRAATRTAARLLARRERCGREADGTAAQQRNRASPRQAALAELRGRPTRCWQRLADEEARGSPRRARRVGGRRLDEDLVVDPGLRAAVEAALGERRAATWWTPRRWRVLPASAGSSSTDRTDQAGARRQAGALADTTIRERVTSAAAASSPRRSAETPRRRPTAAGPGGLAAGPGRLSRGPAGPAARLGCRAA